MPLVSQTFDQLLDFTRTTSGTFVGSNGLIQNTPASVNLLTWTQQFDNAAWIKANSTTVTANTTVAPDGTSTADTLTIGSTLSATGLFRDFVLAAGHSLSCYAKAGTTPFFSITNDNVTGAFANFNLNTGTVLGSSNCTASITAVGNGWYRCSIANTTAASTYVILVAKSSNIGSSQPWQVGTGVVGENVFIWGAQLEAAATASTYTRNNGGVFPPRFDYDPVTLAAKGLLVEEQRTNLLLYSQQFDNAVWTKRGVTLTSGQSAPDGTSSAFLAVVQTGAMSDLYATATGSSAAYTFSVYAKASGKSWVYLLTAQGSGSNLVYFNVSTGVVGTTVGTGITATITPAGNGWYRCTVTQTSSASYAQFGISDANNSIAVTGDGTSGLFIWGAQLEAGAFATSYIPTVASQVTRTADQTSIVAPNFSSWYNQSEGTFVVEATVSTNVDGGVGNYYLTASDGTNGNRIAIAEISGTTSTIVAGGVVQFDETIGAEPTGIVKAALAYAANNTVSSVNGAIGTTDTSVSIPTANRLDIGVRGDLRNDSSLNGHIRSIRYYPTRLTNAQLQALTA